MAHLEQRMLKLAPEYRARVWGGRRLRASDPPTGEAWIACGSSRVVDGPMLGRTLDDLAAAAGPELLGSTGAARFGGRFPLLVKLLDCRDWLSVQVHPNDEQARRLVGPDAFGKTEAWYFLAAEAGSSILAGVRPGVSRDELAEAIRHGRIVDVAERVDIHAGEALLIPAGTLHALGPGLFLYEIQQASDTTYRAYDWGRPASDGRSLHIEESVEVTTTEPARERTRPEIHGGSGTAPVVACDYFDLDLVGVSAAAPVAVDTGGLVFNIVTVVDGSAELRCGRERAQLGRYETALVAGVAGEYEIVAVGDTATLLRAAIPGRAPVAAAHWR